MRVFVTGATGFIGSTVVSELIRAGHQAIGLSRSEEGGEMLRRAGAEVSRGEVNDREHLRLAVHDVDGVIHTAFNHDFSQLKQHSEEDRRVIETLGELLAGSDRPLVITSGTGLVRSKSGDLARETDDHFTAAEFARAATEEAADALIASGQRAIVMRLPQVHDRRRFGRISEHIRLAREQGRVAYVGEGSNRLPAVHVSDVAVIYRLAIEKGRPGARYHAVGEEAVAIRAICEAIGAKLALPVESISLGDAPKVFGPLAKLAAIDLAASGRETQQELGWRPSGPDLLTDLRNMDLP